MNTEYELARQVLNLANQIIKNRNKHLKQIDITAEQADALTFFHTGKGNTISDLKDYLHISHQTARGIVKRMEQKQLLNLASSEQDGRYKTVTITEYGKAVIKHLKENGTHTGYKLLKGMSPDEQNKFAELISSALKNIQ